jgi:hypothetical protein
MYKRSILGFLVVHVYAAVRQPPALVSVPHISQHHDLELHS